jgi:hypothetical protein
MSPRAARSGWSASPRHRGRIDTRARDSRAAESTTPGVVDSVVDSARFPEARTHRARRVRARSSHATARNSGSARGATTRDRSRDVSARPVAARGAFSKTPYAHANSRRSEHRCARWRRPPTCTDPLAEMDVLARMRIGSRVIDFVLATTRSEPAAVLAHRHLTRTTARPARASTQRRHRERLRAMTGSISVKRQRDPGGGRRRVARRTQGPHPTDPRDRAAAAGRRDGRRPAQRGQPGRRVVPTPRAAWRAARSPIRGDSRPRRPRKARWSR